MEPWLHSYYLSSDRLSDRFGDQPYRSNSTLSGRKKMLEDSHEGETTMLAPQAMNRLEISCKEPQQIKTRILMHMRKCDCTVEPAC